MTYFECNIEYVDGRDTQSFIELKKINKDLIKQLLKAIKDKKELLSSDIDDFDYSEISKRTYCGEMDIEYDVFEDARKMPKKTPKQRQKRAEAILECLNDDYDDPDNCDSSSDHDYAEGKRDGYSSCLNDLFGTGNSF